MLKSQTQRWKRIQESKVDLWHIFVLTYIFKAILHYRYWKLQLPTLLCKDLKRFKWKLWIIILWTVSNGLYINHFSTIDHPNQSELGLTESHAITCCRNHFMLHNPNYIRETCVSTWTWFKRFWSPMKHLVVIQMKYIICIWVYFNACQLCWTGVAEHTDKALQSKRSERRQFINIYRSFVMLILVKIYYSRTAGRDWSIALDPFQLM